MDRSLSINLIRGTYIIDTHNSLFYVNIYIKYLICILSSLFFFYSLLLILFYNISKIIIKIFPNFKFKYLKFK